MFQIKVLFILGLKSEDFRAIFIKEILSDPDFIFDEDRKNMQDDLRDGSDYVDVIENDDVEGLTIQTTEINLTNGNVDY